ncbi:hypothetical protein PsYK624_172240 [Phanerochaete sordida]|uniref:Uncharacterized protein n=1 Tax=Phanerochaete sordida TaxID=48140 RepID=A0A9P3GV54_9APHY|nr:hypothetical protein PsYK624_172240 [Phanerochaete sordida]
MDSARSRTANGPIHAFPRCCCRAGLISDELAGPSVRFVSLGRDARTRYSTTATTLAVVYIVKSIQARYTVPNINSTTRSRRRTGPADFGDERPRRPDTRYVGSVLTCPLASAAQRWRR